MTLEQNDKRREQLLEVRRNRRGKTRLGID